MVLQWSVEVKFLFEWEAEQGDLYGSTESSVLWKEMWQHYMIHFFY